MVVVLLPFNMLCHLLFFHEITIKIDAVGVGILQYFVFSRRLIL